MKTSLYLAVIVCISSLFSCQPPVVFDAPQPENVGNLSKFPNRVQGVFVNQDLSDTLFVNEKDIILHLTYFDINLKSDLDSNLKLVGDTLVYLNSGDKVKVTISGDSIISQSNYVDSLFSINTGDVLRKFKGHFFLNQQYKAEQWQVSDLQYTNNRIMISEISTKEEIELLKAVTDTKNDSTNIFHPSKQQFKEFVKSGGFGAGEMYYRIK